MATATKPTAGNLNTISYVIGIAIGDGNLSNPNGRAVRLRVTCDTAYPKIIKNITEALQEVMPNNKVSVVRKKETCIDISCYSNKWEDLLGWKAKGGSKFAQKVSVPYWIKRSRTFSIFCLRGLIETDGSIYKDRNYITVNFVTIIPSLAKDVIEMITCLGFTPNLQLYKATNGKMKHTIRVSKRAREFIEMTNISKS